MLKGWLERAAERFNRIDPAKREPQELVNRKLPSYNFDVIQGGITYAIDVTQPEGERIRDLAYPRQSRSLRRSASSSSPTTIAPAAAAVFRGSTARTSSLSAPDANRDVLIEWVREHKHVTRAANGSDRNWRFATGADCGSGRFRVGARQARSSPKRPACVTSLVKDNGDGFSTYAIDFAAKQQR